MAFPWWLIVTGQSENEFFMKIKFKRLNGSSSGKFMEVRVRSGTGFYVVVYIYIYGPGFFIASFGTCILFYGS